MDRARLQRRTLPSNAAVPGTQAYSDHEGRLWFDLKHVHMALSKSGYPQDWRYFRRGLAAMWGEAGVDASEFFLGQAPGTHVTDICSARALLTALWMLVTKSRTPGVIAACTTCFEQACALAGQVPWLDSDSDARFEDERRELVSLPGKGGHSSVLTLDRLHRRVAGMQELVNARHHCSRESWTRAWADLHSRGTISEPLGQCSHTLLNVVLFALRFIKTRRDHSSKNTTSIAGMTSLCRSLVAHLSRSVVRYILQASQPEDLQDRSAQSWVSPRKVTQHLGDNPQASASDENNPLRKYVKVQPEAVWKVIEEARRAGCSLEQVVEIRREDGFMGCSSSNCPEWRGRLGDMYRERRKMSLDKVHHLFLCADPATHVRKSTMATLVWSWEAGSASHGDLQIMGSANTIKLEESLPDHISALVAQNRCERMSAYRELQAWSNCVRGLGHWPRGLAEFVLPEGIEVHPVEPGEVRIVRQGANEATAWRVTQATGACRPMLPPGTLASTQGFKLAVLGLDQGAVGAAATAFADHMKLMMLPRWDKFHRIIRDVRLSTTHCCDGVFLKAQVFSTYLWCVNQKPFGTGTFLTQKHNLLNVFIATKGIGSPVFLKYVDRIARDLGMSSETDAEKQLVFDALVPSAKSFQLSGEIPKMGRWFSWNASAHRHLPEFWIMRMVLEDQFDDVMDPDQAEVAFSDVRAAAKSKTPQAELAALKAANGGLRLALRLMSFDLWVHCKILSIVTRPCWTWYVLHVKNVTTPKCALQATLASTQGRWRHDSHFSDIVHQAFCMQSLEYMGVPEGDTVLSGRCLSLTWHILSNRAWSMAVRSNGPPECYAGLLSPAAATQQDAVALLRSNWEKITRLEQRRLTLAAADRLWADIQFLTNTPIRLLHVVFEAALYRTECRLGKHLLRGMLDTLPDNKIVEEVHCGLRNDQNKTRSRDRSWARLQHVAAMTPVLESRGIPHTACVTRDHFVRHCRAKRSSAGWQRHLSAKHRMPQSWANIMGTRTWTAHTEQSSRRSIAAWQWYLEGYPQAKALAATQGWPAPGLEDSLLSGLLGTHQVVQNTRTGVLSASLGHSTYAVLLYPIQILHEDTTGRKTMRFQGRPAAVSFDYVVHVADWFVLPQRARRCAQHGVVLEQTGPPEPLAQAALRQKPLPSFRTLQQLARHLGVHPAGQVSTQELVRLIAQKEQPGNEEFLQEALQNTEECSTNSQARLMQDPLFEAAYDELPEDDREEFGELKKAKVKQRVRHHMASASIEARKRKHTHIALRRVRRRRAALEPPPPAQTGPGANAGSAAAPSVTPATAAAATEAPAVAAEAAAEQAVAAQPRADRAGADGWARLYHPSRQAFVRLSRNPDGSWDMRGMCERCPATFSRTCKPPPATARAGTRAFGQGRPFGKVWLWVEMACALPQDHTAESHPPKRSWEPEFAERRDARVRGSAQPFADEWLREERPPHPLRDGDAGEPLLIL